MKSKSLYFQDGRSDKIYTAVVDGGTVTFSWGRRGSTMQVKEVTGLSSAEAEALWSSKLAEKTAKGYQPGPDATPLQTVNASAERMAETSTIGRRGH